MNCSLVSFENRTYVCREKVKLLGSEKCLSETLGEPVENHFWAITKSVNYGSLNSDGSFELWIV